MSIRRRVLEARLAEKVAKDPGLARQMGIEIRYPQKTDTVTKRHDNKIC